MIPIIIRPTSGSPGAKTAPEFLMVYRAAPGFAYAVKPVVGTPSLFVFSKLFTFLEFPLSNFSALEFYSAGVSILFSFSQFPELPPVLSAFRHPVPTLG